MGAAILSGFANPVHQAQQAYRAILDAMSHPGRIVEISGVSDSPKPLSQAATACALTLLDFETTLWLSPDAWPARDYLVFHCHCPFSDDTGKAAFALIPGGAPIPDLGGFPAGTHEHPETSATLIIEVSSLSEGTGLHLSGPGIETATILTVDGLTPTFWEQMQSNHEAFPLGVDVILTHGHQLAALPRTTKIEVL